MKTIVVIPAFNEAATIRMVVESIPYPVLVVDDGSTDETASEASEATVLTLPSNIGYDHAIAHGLVVAQIGYEIAVTFDADGQHHPDDISRLVQEIEEGADIAVGVRLHTPRLSEWLFNIYGKRRGVTDALCGLKAYNLLSVRSFLHLAHKPSMGTALVFEAARRGLKIANIPVRIRARKDFPRLGGMKILKAWRESYG